MKETAPMNTYVELMLSGEETDFIKWLAKRDRVAFHEELQMMFYTELRQLQDLHSEEMRTESEDR